MAFRSLFNIKLIIFLSLFSVELGFAKAEKANLGQYERIANSHLKSFDVEGKDVDLEDEEERKLDVQDDYLSMYDVHKLALEILAPIKGEESHVVNESLWRDLDLFCGTGENTEAHLLSRINRTSTVFGFAYLAKMLSSPLIDVDSIKKRQAVVKELIDNRELFASLSKQLNKLGKVDDKLLSFWTGKDRDNSKFIDKAMYYNFGPLKRLNKSSGALEFTTRLQQFGTVLSCSIYPFIHFKIHQLNNISLRTRNMPPIIKDLRRRFAKLNPDYFLKNSDLLNSKELINNKSLAEAIKELREKNPSLKNDSSMLNYLIDEYEDQLSELKKEEKVLDWFNKEKLEMMSRFEGEPKSLNGINANEGIKYYNELYSELCEKDPEAAEKVEAIFYDLTEGDGSLGFFGMRSTADNSEDQKKMDKNLEDKFENRARRIVGTDKAKKYREMFFDKNLGFVVHDKFRNMANLDDYDSRKSFCYNHYPEFLKKYPALALNHNRFVDRKMFEMLFSGTGSEKAKAWWNYIINNNKHELLNAPKSIQDVLTLKNERFILKGLFGKDEYGLNKKMYMTFAGLELGLIAFAAFSAYKAIPQQQQANEIANYLQSRLIAVADYLRGIKNIGKLVFTNKILRANLLLNQEMLGLFDSASRKSEDFDNLVGLLSKKTFEGEASFFSWTGRVLAAYKLMLEAKDEFTEAFEALGEVDAHMSIARLYKEHNRKSAVFSFAKFSDSKTPRISLRDFWNPFIDSEIVVKNDLDLGGEDASNIILTGPNAGGKSTVLKAISINILLAQTLGIAPSSNITITPFARINTYLNISDDIAAGNSMFKAEVLRAKKLLKSIKGLGDGELSFSIMDEMFSGTAPKEGEAASYTVAKSLGKQKKSMCLIATHFPKMTDLEKDTGGMFKNYRVQVTKNLDGSLTYPYNFEVGKVDQNIAFDILANEGVLDEFELSEAQSVLEDLQA